MVIQILSKLCGRLCFKKRVPSLRSWLLVPVIMVASGGASGVDYAEGDSLRVIGSNVIMREAPYQGARVIGTLSEYDHLIFTGEYTVEPITVTVRGQRVSAPFISVRADDGREGWVFDGLVTDDGDLALLKNKVELVTPGSSRGAVQRLYGRDYIAHDRRMRSQSTQNLLNRLEADQAWEYYYFRTGEGVAFGFDDDRVVSVSVRQDTFGENGATYWRSVEGYLNHPLQPECHENPGSEDCDDYLR